MAVAGIHANRANDLGEHALQGRKQVLGTYGHGAHNDFVLIYDPENTMELRAEHVARICSRTGGIGADGLIRVGRAGNTWFMDYRNGDGSLAEMCGNGVRVLAWYVVQKGFEPLRAFDIATRAGVKHAVVRDGSSISVTMSTIAVVPGAIAVTANGRTWTGYNIDAGNPHAVVFVDHVADAGSLLQLPSVAPAAAYPRGVNVEFVAPEPGGELRMRVYERGVGETQACGTGTCAVARAASLRAGTPLPATWAIHCPGGRLVVDLDANGGAVLTGPAELVRDVDLTAFFT